MSILHTPMYMAFVHWFWADNLLLKVLLQAGHWLVKVPVKVIEMSLCVLVSWQAKARYIKRLAAHKAHPHSPREVF